IDLLKCIGNGFANFSNISERNEKLRPFVTEECAKENGLDFESACQLPSSGKIKEIYMPLEKENHYALVLDCVQNGAPVKLLILVEITGDKVSHIDYNDVRESY
ncbi:EF0163 family protein, partial [Enterococcus sp. C76]